VGVGGVWGGDADRATRCVRNRNAGWVERSSICGAEGEVGYGISYSIPRVFNRVTIYIYLKIDACGRGNLYV